MRNGVDRKFRKARIWSNEELRKYAPIFSGSVVNVSAWKDNDKEGNKYKEYFINADEYYITNYGGDLGECGDPTMNEIKLDLEKDLPKELNKRFDVVFNHTVLEHVFDCYKAFSNLCNMAKDACIVVVPWMQEVHISNSYKDYWRYSPYVMEALFAKEGFRMVVCEYNNDFDTAVYLFCIGIREEKLSKYKEFCPLTVSNELPAGRWLGVNNRIWAYIKNKIHLGGGVYKIAVAW